VLFETDETQNRFATTQAIIRLEHGEGDRPQMAFIKEGDRWLIEAFGWFPPRPPSPAPARPGM
jgi:hypothetical protein